MLPAGPEVVITADRLALTADMVTMADKAVIKLWADLTVGARAPVGEMTEDQLCVVFRHVKRLRKEYPKDFGLPWDLVRYFWYCIGDLTSEALHAVASEGRWECWWKVRCRRSTLRARLVWVWVTWPRQAPSLSRIVNFLAE